jgi:hypothetical protein
MTNGKIFLESVLDLPDITLVLGVPIVAVSIGRDVWLVWRGDE